ncbi:MAG TPA: RICIN domain-containing protein [Actinoplanes sp.]|jgi:hypothetical protein
MIFRRAGLAVLAASALTLTLPTPGASAAGADTPAQPAGGTTAGFGGWPLPVPDVSGLLPGLYAVNVASFECLTAPAGSGPASQRHCVLDDAYRWKLVPVSLDARFKVENAGSGRCLVPAGQNDLAAGPCGDALGDTWRLKDAPGTGIYVINAASDRCLTVERDGRAVQYRCDGDVSRRWTFRLEPNGKGVVTVNGGKP